MISDQRIWLSTGSFLANPRARHLSFGYLAWFSGGIFFGSLAWFRGGIFCLQCMWSSARPCLLLRPHRLSPFGRWLSVPRALRGIYADAGLSIVFALHCVALRSVAFVGKDSAAVPIPLGLRSNIMIG